jgi:hypothetical protein
VKVVAEFYDGLDLAQKEVAAEWSVAPEFRDPTGIRFDDLNLAIDEASAQSPESYTTLIGGKGPDLVVYADGDVLVELFRKHHGDGWTVVVR